MKTSLKNKDRTRHVIFIGIIYRRNYAFIDTILFNNNGETLI